MYLKQQAELTKTFEEGEKSDKKLRREGLLAHLHTLKTILRQGIAIYRHDSNESNIFQFDKDKSNYVPGLKKLLTEGKYMSYDIISEQVEKIVLVCRRVVNATINQRSFFCIICDEATDVSKIEQMSFTVRHCSDDYDIKEDFIGVYPCDGGLTADALLVNIQDIMRRCTFKPEKMIGCAFDGASVMKSLGSKIKDQINPLTLRVHCLAHCNELVFKDTTKASSFFREAQDLCEDLYVLVGVSPKRIQLFEDIQRENEDTQDVKKLKNLSRTRWTTRGPAAKVILDKHQDLVLTVQTLKNDSSASAICRAKARGLEATLNSFPAMFGIRAMNHLSNGLEHHSKLLQSSALTAEMASSSLQRLQIYLNEQREYAAFARLIEETEKFTGLIFKDELPAKRVKRTPASLVDFGYNQTSFSDFSEVADTPEQHLRVIYREAVDAMRTSLKERFDQDDLKLLVNIENVLLKSVNKGEANLSDLHMFQKYISTECLLRELRELPMLLKLFNEDKLIQISEVTSLTTLCDIMASRQSNRMNAPNVLRLLLMYNTMALSSASAERSFSVMRRLKTWVRSRMSANLLTNSMFASIHSESMDKVNINLVAEDFISANERRKHYFGD